MRKSKQAVVDAPAPPPVEEVITLGIDEIIPYWRNPRNATDADINKIMRSIEEYGYQAPIIVDKDHVIVVGHTRYLALRRLGWKEVPVLVSDLSQHAAKEYRIIDNRAGEFVAWDRQLLLTELKDFTSETMLELFFPEMDVTAEELTEFHLTRPPKSKLEGPKGDPDTQYNKIAICPHCFHQFDLAESGQ